MKKDEIIAVIIAAPIAVIVYLLRSLINLFVSNFLRWLIFKGGDKKIVKAAEKELCVMLHVVDNEIHFVLKNLDTQLQKEQ